MPPEDITKEQADYALSKLGYNHIVVGSDSLVMYQDPAADDPSYPIVLDFSRGSIPWPDVMLALERAGIDPEQFQASL